MELEQFEHFGGLVFHITITPGNSDEAQIVRIIAEDPNPLRPQSFTLDIPSDQIPSLTRNFCEDPLQLKQCILQALRGQPNTKANLQRSSSGKLSLSVTHILTFCEKSFEIVLNSNELTTDDKIEKLIRCIGNLSCDTFSKREGHKNSNLDLFLNGCGMIKVKGGNSHDSVTTGIQYTSGQHYLQFKVILCANNYCMIGVQEELKELTPYPGHATFASGKALYGANGHCYQNGTSSDYGIGAFGAGTYVGVLLDMDAKKLTFSINGRKGNPLDLVGRSYYFIVNVHTVGDAVKLCPKYCYHIYE